MLRRLIRAPRTQEFLARLLALFALALYRTMRWRIIGGEHLVAALAPRDGAAPPAVIFSFWHERLPVMGYSWYLARRLHQIPPGHRTHVLVSPHRDGRLIGNIVARFDVEAVHGSTNKQGAAGLRALIRLLRSGQSVAITPDGPRGPRREAAPGVAQLSGMARIPVLPCAGGASRMLRLGTWDRMAVPLPFSRGVFLVMPPIQAPRDAPETALPAIAAAMTEACERIDRAFAAPR